MKHISPKIKILLYIRIVTVVLGISLLWMGIDIYLITRDPLAQIESQNTIAMAIVVILLFVSLLSGLILSIMLEIRRYIRYFSIYIGLLLIMLVSIRSLFG